MKVISSIEIDSNKEQVWQTITDFNNWSNIIGEIHNIEILEKPSNDFVGLKWIETRTMFGKEATEIMWITSAEVNVFYETRAESHGSIYLTKVSILEKDNRIILTQEFEGISQKIIGKIMMKIMGNMFKKSIEKSLYKDLKDIKKFIENSSY